MCFGREPIRHIKRPYFLAGRLDLYDVKDTIKQLKPYAVDVSSGIEPERFKSRSKMKAFVSAVRKEDRI